MPPSKMAAKSKASPSKVAPAAPQASRSLAPDDGTLGCRFNVKGIARLLSIVAMMLLMTDVVLSHKNSVMFCTIAAGLLFGSMLLNLMALTCIYTGGVIGDEEHAAAANSSWKADAAALANLIALDSFLYEETSYNHWGHSENVLREERLFAAFLEVAIALWIFFNVSKHQLMDENAVAKASGYSMV